MSVSKIHVLMRESANLALHGHDEDSGRAVADDELIKVLRVGNDSIDGRITAGGGLGRSEGARAITGFGIPHAHGAITGRGNDLQVMLACHVPVLPRLQMHSLARERSGHQSSAVDMHESL